MEKFRTIQSPKLRHNQCLNLNQCHWIMWLQMIRLRLSLFIGKLLKMWSIFLLCLSLIKISKKRLNRNHGWTKISSKWTKTKYQYLIKKRSKPTLRLYLRIKMSKWKWNKFRKVSSQKRNKYLIIIRGALEIILL